MEVLVVSRANHAGRTWTSPPDFRFAAGRRIIQVGRAEAGGVASYAPLAFRRRGESGVDLIAFTGFSVGPANLLVSDTGQWQGSSVPFMLDLYPFVVAEGAGGEAPRLCVDESMGLVRRDGEGFAFFQEDGKPSRELVRITRKAKAHAADLAQARVAIKALDDAGLLVPLKVGVRRDGPQPPGPLPQGVMGVDFARLDGLGGESLVSLRNSGALELAYIHKQSLSQVGTLAARLSQQRAAASSPLLADGLIRFSQI